MKPYHLKNISYAKNAASHFSTKFLLQKIFVFYLFSLTVTVTQAQQNEKSYQAIPFELDKVNERIVPIDLNGDGLIDFLTADKSDLTIYFQKSGTTTEKAFNFAKADLTLTLPGKAVGWDLDWNTALLPKVQSGEIKSSKTQSPTNQPIRIVAIVDGKQVIAWPIANNQLGAQEILIDNLQANIPLGAYPLDFVRDINSDELNDFVVPGSDQFNIYLQQKNGKFVGDIQLKSNVFIESTLVSENDLTTKIGQEVRIPNIRIRDVNGDDRKDLVARTDGLLEVFFARSDNSYNTEPNYHYDFNEIDERLGEPSLDNFDLSNLSSATQYTYNYLLDDINGDKIQDLLIREAGKVVFYLGTKDGMNFEQPQQVLRSGGNVFAAVLLDEDKDDLKDLWLVRVEDISLGRAFVWVALSGSINIEAFIYRNEGERFARRPHLKKTVSITFPSLIKSIGIYSDIEEMSESKDVTRTLAANINAVDDINDLLILDKSGIKVHLDVLEKQLTEEEQFLGLIDDIREKDEFTIDLNEILSKVSVQGQKHLSIVQGRKEDFILTLNNASDDLDPASDIWINDLNNDSHDDILLVTQRKDETIKGILYLSNP